MILTIIPKQKKIIMDEIDWKHLLKLTKQRKNTYIKIKNEILHINPQQRTKKKVKSKQKI